ncbi:MAG: hypothetical protein WC130_11685, partial [Kiritimatiellia bacterium]
MATHGIDPQARGLAARPNLNMLAGLVPAADKLPYFNSASTMALTDFVTQARSFVGDPDAQYVNLTQAGSGAVERTVQADLREVRRTPKQYGATADGTTDDRASFVACDAVGDWVLEYGNYKISASVTFSNNVQFRPGAVLVIPTGVTVTFSGFFDAGVYQCFNCTGTGSVVFNWNKRWIGYPEWWGAKADLSVDCTASINASIVALLLTQLQGGDYYSSGTILMQLDHRSLIGVGAKYSDIANTQTRILTADGTQYGMTIGPDSFPGSINALQKNNLVQDVYFSRLVGPVIASSCVGVQMQWTLMTRMKNVKVAESMIGFRLYGTVTPKCDDLESVRSVAGTGAGTDSWRGYWIDGSASIGAAGGNASVYISRASASCNLAALQTAGGNGFYVDQAFTDVFLDNPETVNCYYGIIITGNDAAGNTFSNTDLYI